MALRVYLDTSVISALLDERSQERMAETREFWERLHDFEVYTSSLVREEIERVSDAPRREEMLRLLDSTKTESVTEDMKELAHRYVSRGLFTAAMYSDALHLAAAVLTRQDILVSWNFRHLVNRRTRAQVNEANTSLGLPGIEILAPSEV